MLVGSVRLFVCVRECVCPFALCISHSSIAIFTKHTGRHRPGEKLVKFGNFSACGSGSRTLSKDSSTLRESAFCKNFAKISLKNRSDLRENFTTYVSSDKDVFLKFRNSSRSRLQIQTSDTEHIRTSVLIVRLTYIVFWIYRILFRYITPPLTLTAKFRLAWSVIDFFVIFRVCHIHRRIKLIIKLRGSKLQSIYYTKSVTYRHTSSVGSGSAGGECERGRGSRAVAGFIDKLIVNTTYYGVIYV